MKIVLNFISMFSVCLMSFLQLKEIKRGHLKLGRNACIPLGPDSTNAAHGIEQFCRRGSLILK